MASKRKRRLSPSALRKARSERAKAAYQRRIASELALSRSRAAKKGWATRRARPKQGGWELKSLRTLAQAVIKLPGTGRGNTPRNYAHRALVDRLAGSDMTWHDVVDDIDLDIDHEDWDDLENHYH